MDCVRYEIKWIFYCVMIRATEIKCIFSLRWFFRFCPKVMNPALYKNRSCYPPLHVCLYSLPSLLDSSVVTGKAFPSPTSWLLQTPEGICDVGKELKLSYMKRPIYELANKRLTRVMGRDWWVCILWHHEVNKSKRRRPASLSSFIISLLHLCVCVCVCVCVCSFVFAYFHRL